MIKIKRHAGGLFGLFAKRSRRSQKNQVVVEMGDEKVELVNGIERYNNYKSQVKDSSPVDVHTCHSLVCMACSKTPDIKFIEVPGEGTNKHDEKNEPFLPNTSAKEEPKKKRFIIENISSIGVVRTADAQKQDRNNKEITGTESLSDDTSVDRFIESIENGYRGFF